MSKIEMVDLKGQYIKIQDEIMQAVSNCFQSTAFINGPEVKQFAGNLAAYMSAAKVIPCANGTDALQIAMMALDLKPGDEVIVPAFTYAATAEVIGLLHLKPVMVDVDPDTFNVTADLLSEAITEKTKAIVPVHLFGQCADMEPIMELAAKHNLAIIEDTAQAIGAEYTFADGHKMKAGTIAHVGCTSFFPSKNLGCYGDGGAIFTNDADLGKKLEMICNHGQSKKYQHTYIGVNSRLDTLQAAILDIKLRNLSEYTKARNEAANRYDSLLAGLEGISIPVRSCNSTHVFHQYTIKVHNNKRDQLKEYLNAQNIPSMIYYPIPLNEQEAYQKIGRVTGSLNTTATLCAEVLSLPMHTELTEAQQQHITDTILKFFAR